MNVVCVFFFFSSISSTCQFLIIEQHWNQHDNMREKNRKRARCKRLFLWLVKHVYSNQCDLYLNRIWKEILIFLYWFHTQKKSLKKYFPFPECYQFNSVALHFAILRDINVIKICIRFGLWIATSYVTFWMKTTHMLHTHTYTHPVRNCAST